MPGTVIVWSLHSIFNASHLVVSVQLDRLRILRKEPGSLDLLFIHKVHFFFYSILSSPGRLKWCQSFRKADVSIPSSISSPHCSLFLDMFTYFLDQYSPSFQLSLSRVTEECDACQMMTHTSTIWAFLLSDELSEDGSSSSTVLLCNVLIEKNLQWSIQSFCRHSFQYYHSGVCTPSAGALLHIFFISFPDAPLQTLFQSPPPSPPFAFSYP